MDDDVKGAPPREVSTGDVGRLRVVADFPVITPDRLFGYWVCIDGLRRWWKPEGTVDARAGGTYDLRWHTGGFRLTGRYLTVDLGQTLRFTWVWDHLPDKVTEVNVLFSADESRGTRLTLEHGPWDDDPAGRSSHLDGWLYFLARLQEHAAADRI